jgi:hypothetical protein
MWNEFTEEEITDALRGTSSKSAPGPDGIGWAVWRNVAKDKTGLQGLLRIVKKIILQGEWPEELKVSKTVVIPKLKRPALLTLTTTIKYTFYPFPLTTTLLYVENGQLQLETWGYPTLPSFQASFKSRNAGKN